MKLRLPRAVRDWAAAPRLSRRGLQVIVGGLITAAVVGPLMLVALPYLEFFNDMAVQYKVRPQMTWKLVDGKPTGLDPRTPKAAVPREGTPYPFANRDPKLLPTALAWLTRADPPPPEPYRAPAMTVEVMQRGQKVFQSTCIVCHGPYAFGNGTLTRLGFPAPPSLHSPEAQAYPRERIFHIATAGQNVMPPYAGQLRPEDRWAAASYVKVLQHAFAPPAPTTTTSGPP